MLNDYPDVMSIDEMCRALSIGKKTGYKLLQTGQIRFLKIGRAYRIPKINLLEYLQVIRPEWNGPFLSKAVFFALLGDRWYYKEADSRNPMASDLCERRINMVAGHLHEKNGYYYIILNLTDSAGRRKPKWISTGLTIKGNKKRAE